MDFLAFKAEIAGSQPPKWTPRQRDLDAFDRALYGQLYGHKAFPFSQESSDPQNVRAETILLDKRRAAVQYRLPLMLVRDVVGRLWGEAHRPTVVARDDKDTAAWVQAFLRDTSFWLTLIEASWGGSSGSACVVLRILGDAEIAPDGSSKPKGKGRYYAEVWPTKECQPVFDRNRPGELLKLERIQQITADTLRAEGYDVDALERKWNDKKFGRSGSGRSRAYDRDSQRVSPTWMLRMVLDRQSETWYEPVPSWLYNRQDFVPSEWVKDAKRSFDHNLDEVPARWARPIPFPASTFPDGLCLFEPVIDFQFRIDRTLSQTGRAFDYVGDPQLSVDKDAEDDNSGEFGNDDGAEQAGATGIIEGDAKFVEISGNGLRVAIEHYCKALIRLAREVGGGSRIDEDQNVGAMSGTAMRLMNAALDVLAGILRITLGEKLFIDVLRLAMRMSEKVDVELPSLPAIMSQSDGAKTGKPNPVALLDLQWPDAYAPTGQDLLFQMQAIELAASATNGPPLISIATAVAAAASLFGTQDAKQEEADIIADTQLRATLSPTEAQPQNDPRDAGKEQNASDS